MNARLYNYINTQTAKCRLHVTSTTTSTGHESNHGRLFTVNFTTCYTMLELPKGLTALIGVRLVYSLSIFTVTGMNKFSGGSLEVVISPTPLATPLCPRYTCARMYM